MRAFAGLLILSALAFVVGCSGKAPVKTDSVSNLAAPAPPSTQTTTPVDQVEPQVSEPKVEEQVKKKSSVEHLSDLWGKGRYLYGTPLVLMADHTTDSGLKVSKNSFVRFVKDDGTDLLVRHGRESFTLSVNSIVPYHQAKSVENDLLMHEYFVNHFLESGRKPSDNSWETNCRIGLNGLPETFAAATNLQTRRLLELVLPAQADATDLFAGRKLDWLEATPGDESKRLKAAVSLIYWANAIARVCPLQKSAEFIERMDAAIKHSIAPNAESLDGIAIRTYLNQELQIEKAEALRLCELEPFNRTAHFVVASSVDKYDPTLASDILCKCVQNNPDCLEEFHVAASLFGDELLLQQMPSSNPCIESFHRFVNFERQSEAGNEPLDQLKARLDSVLSCVFRSTELDANEIFRFESLDSLSPDELLAIAELLPADKRFEAIEKIACRYPDNRKAMLALYINALEESEETKVRLRENDKSTSTVASVSSIIRGLPSRISCLDVLRKAFVNKANADQLTSFLRRRFCVEPMSSYRDQALLSFLVGREPSNDFKMEHWRTLASLSGLSMRGDYQDAGVRDWQVAMLAMDHQATYQPGRYVLLDSLKRCAAGLYMLSYKAKNESYVDTLRRAMNISVEDIFRSMANLSGYTPPEKLAKIDAAASRFKERENIASENLQKISGSSTVEFSLIRLTQPHGQALAQLRSPSGSDKSKQSPSSARIVELLESQEDVDFDKWSRLLDEELASEEGKNVLSTLKFMRRFRADGKLQEKEFVTEANATITSDYASKFFRVVAPTPATANVARKLPLQLFMKRDESRLPCELLANDAKKVPDIPRSVLNLRAFDQSLTYNRRDFHFGLPDILGGTVRTGIVRASPENERRRYELYQKALSDSQSHNLQVLWLHGQKLLLVTKFLRGQETSVRFALLHSAFYEFTAPYTVNSSAPWLHFLIDYQPLKDLQVPPQVETDLIQ